jgi:hypothetical protein
MRRPVRLVPRAGSVSGRAGRLEARRDRRPGRAARRQRRGHTAGPEADQRTRARAASQGQGAGRNGRLARALKKTAGDLPQGRGRMTRPEDRQTLMDGIVQARAQKLPHSLECRAVLTVSIRRRPQGATGELASAAIRPRRRWRMPPASSSRGAVRQDDGRDGWQSGPRRRPTRLGDRCCSFLP